MWFTTSWDDGHPLDMKLADLLHKHGIAGTFYCPLTNREGLPTLDAVSLRSLASPLCEIGSHTLDHAYATHMPAARWAEQVRAGKAALEQVLGHRVAGFCYPGGKHPGQSRRIVIDAGFDYARSSRNLCLLPGHDPFMLPTTLQTHLHSGSVLLRNLARGGEWAQRAPVARLVMRSGRSLDARLTSLLDWACQQDDSAMLHVWGHSWELEAGNHWHTLDNFFHEVANRVPPARRVTNGGLVQALNLASATRMTDAATDTQVRANPHCP